MTPLIERSVASLVEILLQHADSNKSVEVFKYVVLLQCVHGIIIQYSIRIFGSFTMESILATAFGRLIDIQRGQSSQLAEAAATLFAINHQHKKTSLHYIAVLLSKHEL